MTKQTVNIEEMSEDQIKVAIFDEAQLLEQHQGNIMALKQELVKRRQNPLVKVAKPSLVLP